MNFFDTSVLAAAFLESHPFHADSAKRVAHISRDNAVCAVHTFAELYVTLTRLPRPQRVPPGTAAAIVKMVSTRVKGIALTNDEYIDSIHVAASRGLSGAIVYDALLLACARKSKIQRIYTLNPSHFRLVAPDLSSKISAP